jgi:GntR family transcriptional regulator
MARTRNEPDVALPQRLSARRPKGDQLREILTALIGGMAPGEMLPSERVLAERYGVARGTVRQELDALVTEGLAARRAGYGTFVADQKFLHSSTLSSFSHDMRARGLRPGAAVVAVSVEPAGTPQAVRLEVLVGSPVVHLTRVRTADGVPIALEKVQLPGDRFAGVEEVDFTDTSLYEVLAERWGVHRLTADRRISAVPPTRPEAKLLDIPVTQPCFAIEGAGRDPVGVVEYGRSLYRGDRYDLLVRVTSSA